MSRFVLITTVTNGTVDQIAKQRGLQKHHKRGQSESNRLKPAGYTPSWTRQPLSRIHLMLLELQYFMSMCDFKEWRFLPFVRLWLAQAHTTDTGSPCCFGSTLNDQLIKRYSSSYVVVLRTVGLLLSRRAVLHSHATRLQFTTFGRHQGAFGSAWSRCFPLIGISVFIGVSTTTIWFLCTSKVPGTFDGTRWNSQRSLKQVSFY